MKKNYGLFCVLQIKKLLISIHTLLTQNAKHKKLLAADSNATLYFTILS